MGSSVDDKDAALQTAARRLRASVDELKRELSEADGESPILARLQERIAALVDELTWEIGVPRPPEDEAVLPRLDHLGVAVKDLGEAAKLFVDHLGGTLVGGGSEELSQLKSLHVAFAGGGKIELLEPLADNPIRRFIEKRGEGVHHLTFVVDDIASIVRGLKEAGYRIVDEALTTDGWKEAYVSPRSAHGCLVQLVQTRADFGTAVGGVTVADVLADQWEWKEHKPRRRAQSGE